MNCHCELKKKTGIKTPTFICFNSSMLTLGTSAVSKTAAETEVCLFTEYAYSVHVLGSVLKSAFTLLGFGCVVLGRVGGLCQIWAGLWRHIGFHRVSFTLSLLVVLWASAGNICYVILQQKGDSLIWDDVSMICVDLLCIFAFVVTQTHRVNPQRLHLVSSLLCYGQKLLWVWESIHNSWNRIKILSRVHGKKNKSLVIR